MFRILTLLLLTSSLFASNDQPADSPFNDGRQGLNIDYFPTLRQRTGLSGEDQARAALREHASAYQLPADLANLVLSRVSSSLLGRHYFFQQMVNDIPVEKGEIIVSISYDGVVYVIFNNTWPELVDTIPEPFSLTRAEAYEMAWNDLLVRGAFLAQPSARLVYLAEKGGFRLVWITQISVSQPFGYWASTVDARTGEVLAVASLSVSRKPVADTRTPYYGPLSDMDLELSLYMNEQEARSASKLGAIGAMGTGLTFDPDPRTTLLDENLVNTSPAADFTPAYFTRDLLEITDNGGLFTLVGPWCTILDFEAPATPPSTTNDGNWTATRGDNAFNDSMTYFHLDQSQRYMQGLGFVGATGIQNTSIETDSDGLDGADNSHYIGGVNRLAFGHGCVDDNEDADVILHEYGHAINYWINPGWSGGDTGAMGEGFGDYWAGSYSYSTPNGPTFHPNWVYTWDGHSSCWAGRLLDQTHFMYDPAATYPAHANVGGVDGDELWSAPLFTSLVELIGMGIPRSEVDQIVLEAQFGLGAGLTMRQLGIATVGAAQMLFPAGPHSQVLLENFMDQNIIDVVVPVLNFRDASLDDSLENCDNDGYLDVGETGLLTVRLTNNGLVALTATTAMITSSSDVTISNGGLINFAPSIFGQTVVGSVEVTLNSHSGGLSLVFADITFTDANPQVVPVGIGTAFTANVDEVPNQLTTDNVENGNNVWTASKDQGLADWRVRFGTSTSPDNAWFVEDTASVLDAFLTTPFFQVNGVGNFSFSFFHRHSFEAGGWDGGLIEASTDGTNWVDVGTAVYNGVITSNPSSPISERPAFIDNNLSYPAFDQITVDLGSVWQGQTLQIRFRIGCDGAAEGEGWFLDDISFPTLDSPLFLEQVPETEVCLSCFETPQAALDAIYSSLGAGNWPGTESVLNYVEMLENICVE